MREPTAWVIVNSAGNMMTGTVADKRRKAIELLVGPEPGYITRWRWWYRSYGCRAVRVRLVRDGGE